MVHYVIIVAGGTGRRMEQDTPKQFLLLNGIPVLMHTLKAFHAENKNTHLILALTESENKNWYSLCHEYQFSIPHTIVPGGKFRYHSVLNGLNFIFDNEKDLKKTLIAIHDGARPLVSQKLISRAFSIAKEKGIAVPAIQSTDSIRIKESEKENHTYPREKVYMIQTPQVFAGDILKKGYEQAFDQQFTDDATVVEKAGYPIHIIEGDIQNIKITYPSDMNLALYWIKQRPF